MSGSSGLKNLTIPVPNGTTFYQNPTEICTPAGWMDIVLFFLANYVAHLATIRIEPGSTWGTSFITFLSCFFFPLYGLQNALNSILHGSMIAPEQIQKAVRVGALCMVVEGNARSGMIPRYEVLRAQYAGITMRI
jgi:hypothetical protein